VEVAKVATSPGPLGTVAGIQFAAVFQSPLTGLALQVALPANEPAAIKHNNKAQMTGKSLFMLRSQQKAAVISRQSGLAVLPAGAQKRLEHGDHRDQANQEIRQIDCGLVRVFAFLCE
jgi:hypothetical protein